MARGKIAGAKMARGKKMEQRREAKILEQKWLEAKIAGAKMA